MSRSELEDRILPLVNTVLSRAWSHEPASRGVSALSFPNIRERGGVNPNSGIVPEGQSKVARRLIAGTRKKVPPVPAGRWSGDEGRYRDLEKNRLFHHRPPPVVVFSSKPYRGQGGVKVFCNPNAALSYFEDTPWEPDGKDPLQPPSCPSHQPPILLILLILSKSLLPLIP